MEKARDKWKRGFSKIVSQNSKEPLSSYLSIDGESNLSETMEVEAYLQKLKSKTAMRNLWTGKKFEDMIEGAHSPDISSDSDDQLELKLQNTFKNINQLRLDSDEDEMRIDYMRERSVDVKNNYSGNSDSVDESLDLMGNIHLAELEIGNVALSNSISEETDNDFLPRIRSAKIEEEKSESHSNSFVADRSRRHHKKSSPESDSLEGSSQSLDESFRDTTSERKTEPTPSAQMTEESLSEILSEHSSYSDDKTSYSKSSYSKTEGDRSVTDSKAKTDSRNEKSINKKRKKSRHRSSNSTQSSSSKRSSRNEFLNDDSNSTLSSEDTRKTSDERSESSKINKTAKKCSDGKNKLHFKRENRSIKGRVGKSNDVETQTNKDATCDVLNFRYDWQRTQPSNIRGHVIDPVSIDILTSYNPSVLAANDLMKFHLQLLRQHIEDSRCLYEAYSNENLNNQYHYTTIEKTKEYIERNRPKVISYEEALQKVKMESKYTE